MIKFQAADYAFRKKIFVLTFLCHITENEHAWLIIAKDKISKLIF